MQRIATIETVHEYNQRVEHPTHHPLVSVMHSSSQNIRAELAADAINFGFYAIFLKENVHSLIKYGRNYYDYQEGTLIFLAPGQVFSLEEPASEVKAKSYGLLFHADLLKGTPLARKMKDFSFFSYDVHEALHLSETEKQIIQDCFQKIEFELKRSVDKHSKSLIVSNIELLLQYCLRFYDRQFITRDYINQGILERFDRLLIDYLESPKLANEGVPLVAYCADQLHLSANYFGDLIKRETEHTAQDYIHGKLLDLAKDRIFDVEKTIAEVGYELGFKYPQHFSRFFKQHVGMTPQEYRNLN